MAKRINAGISQVPALRFAAILFMALQYPVLAQETPAPDAQNNSAVQEEAAGPLSGYLDDRSSPEALIRSYYNAVNRQEYARAYGYYSEEGREPDFEKYAKGYENTKSVTVALGRTEPEGAAGSIYWSLPLAVKSISNDGKEEVFTGCYTIRMANPAMQEIPPYQPMSIMTGSLTPSQKPLEESVPERCETP
ncbi:hypothetical protein C5748_18015 [Phyllobacterium phragmitis]|uniref:Uncharacterized protein n=1 Tax=Phyllobacterium phragmitis TaxID=2670329 RepID=A0A2S9INF3_9HYPH|nr:hypothetical protein C5748_18015 [Phyllobacterium phragmitis]